MSRKPVFVLLDPSAYDFRSVRRQSIHEEDKAPATLMAFELLKIFYEMMRSDRFFLYREHQSWILAIGIADDRAKDCPVLPASSRADEGSASFLGPGISDYRTVGKSCFIMETKGCFGLEPPFLSAGHTSLYQRRMPASFRSLARRTGFWLVQPVDLRIFQTCPG